MGDRYGGHYPRARSPPPMNPARASLPINISNYAVQEGGHHAVPVARREVITAPRSSTSSVTSGGTVTTTYKIKTDVPTRGTSVREGSRTGRSNTMESNSRPHVQAIVTHHRPVVHAGGRAQSPTKSSYRSSEEEYVAIPATTRHGHHHRKRHSSHMDGGDLSRISGERDGRLRVNPMREPAYTTRSRPVYTTSTVVRHPDSVSADYGDNGYGFVKPGDLAQYDLDHDGPVYRRQRRESFDGGRNRPVSINGYSDLMIPRTYETNRSRPPTTTRGFDKIKAPTWERPLRMPTVPSPIDAVRRPAPFDQIEGIEPPRRTNSRARNSTYLDHGSRRVQREEIRDPAYEIKEDHRPRREHRRDSFDDMVEQRGFGIRPERPDKAERVERAERMERPLERVDSRGDRPADNYRPTERIERVERPAERSDRPVEKLERIPDRQERSERIEKVERNERAEPERPREKEHKTEPPKEHKTRDAVTTGLSLAGAALGINAVKNAVTGNKDDRADRGDREDRRRDKSETREERRNEKSESRRDKDEMDTVDISGRDPKERRSREDDAPSRKVTPPVEAARDAEAIDLSGRDPKERPSRKERSHSREHRRRRRSEAAVDSQSSESSSASEETEPVAATPSRRRHRETGGQAFNPKDTMDLKALKEALNAKEPTTKANTSETRARTPRHSTTKDDREAAEIRKDIKEDRKEERRSREPLAAADSNDKVTRVVSPPREKAEDKPVKGILRKPREQFPEDPAPIREGVAPLKDAKKDGIPPDARWTKISRRLVNPEALEAGKERFEARDEFVIVLRVLSREEVQGYAEVTQRIRAAREELEDIEASERRAARRARHEKNKREGRNSRPERRAYREHTKSGARHSHSESDSRSESTDTADDDKVRMLEAPTRRKGTFEDTIMSGGLGDREEREKERVRVRDGPVDMGNLKEVEKGVYTGYTRNPPRPGS